MSVSYMTAIADKTPANYGPVQGFAFMETCKFRIRTVQEAEELARFASQMFRDPARVRPGLQELLVNAVEHGCLQLGELKPQLAETGMLEAEINRRQSLPENRKKSVEVVLARKPEGIFVIITDPGPGFDWKSWITVDPSRASAPMGRGIAMAKSISFDGLTYNARGNQAIAHTRDAQDIVW